MATNYPGPYEMRLFYNANLGNPEHVMHLSLDLPDVPDPGDTFDLIDVQRHSGVTHTLEFETEVLLTLLQPIWPALTDFSRAELWKYEALTFNSDFVSAYTPVITNGTAATASIVAGQAIVTMRTVAGGIFKLSMMESYLVAGARQSFPTGNAAVNALADYFTSLDHAWIARDNARPFAALHFMPGQNERLWKRLYRPS